jgi:peptidoglycan/LPS O-acetylase OafA/YrhL
MIEDSGAEARPLGKNSSIGLTASTDPQRHIGILDDCRGIAIVLVFLRHAEVFLPPKLDHAFDHPWEFASAVFSGKVTLSNLMAFVALFPWHLGWVALPIFFVVSGFCIHLSYCQPARPNLRAFYIRRFFRIYPAYLLALFVFAFFFPYSRLPLNKLFYWAQFGTHVLMCHNLFDSSIYAITASYWTIAIEVQLYLLFPLLLIYVRRSSFTRALLLLLVIEASLHIFATSFYRAPGDQPPAWLRASPFFFCFSWAIGAGIADAYLSKTTLPFTRIHPAVWLLPAILTSEWPAHEFSFSLFALFIASVISRCLSQGSSGERKSYLGRFIRRTGLYSYSIYLIHGPIMIAVVSLSAACFTWIGTQTFMAFAIALASWLITFPLGALMYYWVEKPGIALGKRLLRAWSLRSARAVETRIVSTA